MKNLMNMTQYLYRDNFSLYVAIYNTHCPPVSSIVQHITWQAKESENKEARK